MEICLVVHMSFTSRRITDLGGGTGHGRKRTSSYRGQYTNPRRTFSMYDMVTKFDLMDGMNQPLRMAIS